MRAILVELPNAGTILFAFTDAKRNQALSATLFTSPFTKAPEKLKP